MASSRVNAASRSLSSEMWVYTSAVVLMFECPNSSE